MAGRGQGTGPAAGPTLVPARFPGRAPVDSYGNGGFRFADMSHRGSILALPDGIETWPVTDPNAIDAAALDPLVRRAAAIDVLLFGTGQAHAVLPEAARAALQAAGLAFEVMSTGAAVRTYNVLLSEGRAVAAALIAVRSAVRDR